MNASTKYQITAELLSALETERYQIGVGEHLQLQTLLQKIPDDGATDDLKFALIPLLAKNKVDQDRLYALFDTIAANLVDFENPSVLDEKNLSGLSSQTFWQMVLAVIQKNKIVIAATFLILVAIISAIVLLNRHEKSQNITDKIKVEQPNNQLQKPTETTRKENPFVENKPYPFPNHLEDYSYKPPTKAQEWLQNNWKWARWLLAFAFCGLLIWFWQYMARKNRKLVAEQSHNDKAPYFWNINLEGVDKNIFETNNIEKVSKLLRHRSEADKFRMDMPKTIDATIAQGGSPIFVYKTETSPTDYVLLIDRQSMRNHRARLFDELYAAFKAQEVEIARFFYDSDVRVCFNENYPNGISISDIQQRHFTSRLILIGTGMQLLSPLSGKLAKWTEIFEQFRHRAILSPKPLKLWGYDEKQLANVFTTLPATLEGLSFWLDQLDAGADARFDSWQNKISDAPNAPIIPDEANPIPILQLYFDTDIIKWIAACAIYPTLHFDLTLWLGQEVNNKDKKLCTYQNLTQIFRLSWFVQGEMPKQTRDALLDWFETNDAPKLLQIRAALATELGKNAPPTDSAAFEQFRMNMAVNEWLTEKDAKKKKQLEAEIAEQLRNGVEPDITVIKYLDKPRTRLDFLVPKQWKKFVHPSGYAQLGWLKEWKDLRWLLPMLLIGLVALFWNYKLDASACTNDPQKFQYGILNSKLGSGLLGAPSDDGKSFLTKSTFKDIKDWELREVKFCDDDTLQFIVINEYALHYFILQNKYELAASFLVDYETVKNNSPLSGLGLLDVKAIRASNKTTWIKVLNERNRNLAVSYYYVAKEFYEKKMTDSACYYLNVAFKLDSTDTDINKALRLVCSQPVVYDATKQTASADGILNDIKPIKTTASSDDMYVSTINYLRKSIALIDAKKYATAKNEIDTARGIEPLPLEIQNELKQISVLLDNKDFRLAKLKNLALIDKINKDYLSLPRTDALNASPRPRIDALNASPRTRIDALNASIRDSSLNIEMVFVQGGDFERNGDKPDLVDKFDSKTFEKTETVTTYPVHAFSLDDYYIGKYEVTQAQWRAVMGNNPSKFKGDSLPVEQVSWDDVQEFLKKLNAKSKNKYRLPTEAEWEIAARGGVKSKKYTYSGSNTVTDVAWLGTNSERKTHAVGTLKPNELGIYDMSGNVFEWCSDWYDANYYKNSPALNPQGPEKGDNRVVRGGSWDYVSNFCRVANRGDFSPTYRSDIIGFRVARYN